MTDVNTLENFFMKDQFEPRNVFVCRVNFTRRLFAIFAKIFKFTPQNYKKFIPKFENINCFALFILKKTQQ